MSQINKIKDSMNLTHDEKAIMMLEDVITDIKNGDEPSFILMRHNSVSKGDKNNFASQNLQHNISAFDFACCIYSALRNDPSVLLALMTLQEAK